MIAQIFKRINARLGKLPSWAAAWIYIGGVIAFFLWLAQQPNPQQTMTTLAGAIIGLPVVGLFAFALFALVLSVFMPRR